MIQSAIKFARIRIIITCYALVFLGSVVSGTITLQTFAALAVICVFIIHANSINDLADREIDKINLRHAKDRPLLSSDLTLRTFWILHVLSGLSALLLSLWYGYQVVLITCGILVIDYMYSLEPFKISHRPIASIILLSIAYVYLPLSLGYWSSKPTAPFPWLLSLGIVIAFIARLLLKDFRDIKGDKQYGKKTFLVRFGTKTTIFVSALCWLIGAFLLIAATHYSTAIILLFTIGILYGYYLLKKLSYTKHITQQQQIITAIANTANLMIICLIIYFLL